MIFIIKFPIDHIDSALLETAVQQKLSQVGLILADLPKLLPFSYEVAGH